MFPAGLVVVHDAARGGHHDEAVGGDEGGESVTGAEGWTDAPVSASFFPLCQCNYTLTRLKM